MYPTTCSIPSAPASGATITLISSSDVAPGGGEVVKRIVLRLLSSHISAADGLIFEESFDGGTNYDDLITYTHPATSGAVPYSSYDVAISAPKWRVRYTNSANTLTSWRGVIQLYCGDGDRAAA